MQGKHIDAETPELRATGYLHVFDSSLQLGFYWRTNKEMDEDTQISSARRDCIQIFELRWKLSNEDRVVIQSPLKKLDKKDAEFNRYHYIIVELLENEVD